MIVNLTPHAITVLPPEGKEGAAITIPAPPAGTKIPRVVPPPAGAGDWVEVPGLGKITITRQAAGGEVMDLPDPQKGVLLVVSLAVRSARPDRQDLLSPGPLVRGPDGQPVGCRGLVGNPPPPSPPAGAKEIWRMLGQGWDGPSAQGLAADLVKALGGNFPKDLR